MKLFIVSTISLLCSFSVLASPNHSGTTSGGRSGLNVRSPQINENVLREVYNQATRSLQEVEVLVNGNQPGRAYHAAHELINTIKEKTGINPMAQYREVIPIHGILKNEDLIRTFDQLSNQQKEDLARVVGNYMGGFYLPLLNMAKRAQVIYVKAFYQAHRSTLLRRDVEHMLAELIEIHNFSILLRDSDASENYFLFDMDVADRNYQYAFNKEVVLAALTLEEMGQTESSFESVLRRDKDQRFWDYIQGFRIAELERALNEMRNQRARRLRELEEQNARTQRLTLEYAELQELIKRHPEKSGYQTQRNYERCLNLISNYAHTHDQHQMGFCMAMYSRVLFTSLQFQICYRSQNYRDYPRDRMVWCADNYRTFPSR